MARDLEDGERRGGGYDSPVFKFESEKCLAFARRTSRPRLRNARPDMHLRACQGQRLPGLLILNSATFPEHGCAIVDREPRRVQRRSKGLDLTHGVHTGGGHF